jgi:predicted restriction endonuclease
MQTKIRAMIRNGFVQESNQCPLQWTTMGKVWNDLYTAGNYPDAMETYRFILALSLSLFAFDEDQYCLNPSEGVLPLQYLIKNLDAGCIAVSDLQWLIDGDTARVGANYSYWKGDLINSGLFKEIDNKLCYTNRFPELIDELKVFVPRAGLDDCDWIQIRDNPLIDISPFKNSAKSIFETLVKNDVINDPSVSETFTSPIVELVAEQEEKILPNIDILSQDTKFAQRNYRIRNSIWGRRIKELYNNLCAVPQCDVNGGLFMQGAHIKPDSLPDGDPPHRANVLNGLCLCRNCHAAFDSGLFSLTDDSKFTVSDKIYNLPDQRIRDILIASDGQKIKERTDHRQPLPDFNQYHRANIFLK